MSDRGPLPLTATVAVVGAGAMGAGIAQIAAVAGHPVLLLDAREGAADAAIRQILETLTRLVDKGRLTCEARDGVSSTLRAAKGLSDLADAALVVEAIVERLDAKQTLFVDLEGVVAPSTILATNTSSISVTAIGAALKHPDRLVGMHFFNPAPLMPLVEVISGAATTSDVATATFNTAKQWKKQPVHARSTPGFIVNRVARPFYAEGLRLLQEGAADVATLDAVMRESGGFKMGPFELMDLIGHDVNYAVTRSVFDAYYGDPRFQPSLIQLELVNAGYLGKKTGRGFYDYREGATKAVPQDIEQSSTPTTIGLCRGSWMVEALTKRLSAASIPFVLTPGSVDGRIGTADRAAIFLTDGRTATERSAALQVPDLVLVDLSMDPDAVPRVALARASQCGDEAWRAAVGLFQVAGYAASELRDVAGLAVMRTVAMLANEASDAVNQQVCSVKDADLAMRGGVGYPIGPLEWADRLGVSCVLEVLDHLYAHYGEPRYRASPLLRQCAWARKALHG